MPEWGKFAVGDPVSVWGAYGRTVERLAVVAKAGARKLRLDDKSEWLADGSKMWGMSDGYGNSRLRHRRDGDELNWLRNRAHNALRAIICERLEESDLRLILEIAKRGKAI